MKTHTELKIKVKDFEEHYQKVDDYELEDDYSLELQDDVEDYIVEYEDIGRGWFEINSYSIEDDTIIAEITMYDYDRTEY